MDQDTLEDLKKPSVNECLHCGMSNLVLRGNVAHSVYIEGLGLGQLCVLFLCDNSIHDLMGTSHHIGHTSPQLPSQKMAERCER